MLVTLVGGKIIYGKDDQAIRNYFANSEGKVKPRSRSTIAAETIVPATSGGSRWNDVKARVLKNDLSAFVGLNPQQFLRFKMAGRQKAQTADKQYDMDPLTGGVANLVTIRRAARDARTDALGKWDVAPYGALTGRTGPWGPNGKTNRDHILAHSSNLLRWAAGDDDYGAVNPAQLQRLGLAVAISGEHHRQGSLTYGGRAKKVNALHAGLPQEGVESEIDALLAYKISKGVSSLAAPSTSAGPPAKKSKTGKIVKATLRIEMVGAYVFLYKKLVEQDIIKGDESMDTMLLDYLRAAVGNDDDTWRIDPTKIFTSTTRPTVTSDSLGGSKTERWKVT